MTTLEKGTALITGASSGIGAIYADRLTHDGYDLILVARRRQHLDTLVRRLTDEMGRSVQVFQADLSDPVDLAGVEQLSRTDRTLSMLVNNAGLGATQRQSRNSIASGWTIGPVRWVSYLMCEAARSSAGITSSTRQRPSLLAGQSEGIKGMVAGILSPSARSCDKV